MITKIKKVRAVVFDWAGTTIDYGCRAPLAVFLELFKSKGIPVSIEEASKPMGKLKIEHIRELLMLERVKAEYTRLYKSPPNEDTVQQFNKEFEAHLFKILPNYTDPLPGVLPTMKILREELKLKIGSTTGYTKEMMDIIVPIVKKKGYSPDYLITSSEVKQGRPFPWMIYQNATNLEVPDMHSIVKVGDTVADIKEGNNANCWSVGVVEGSSLMAMTEDEIKSTDVKVINKKKEEVREIFYESGADFVVNSFNDLPNLIHQINNNKLKNNFYPGNTAILPKQPYKLYTPGPLTTTTTVKMTMMTDWGSREKDYLDLVQRVRSELVKFAAERNRENYTSVIMQGSGTFGVESCVGSVVPKNGKLLVLINGAYGKRMSQIAKTLNIDTVEYEVEDTSVHKLDKIEEILKNDSKISHVGYIHSETTTGIVNPIEKINPLLKKYGKVTIVDAMSSYGAIPIDVDKLGIDYLISSSNKNFESVPGFSFIIAKKEELDKCKENKAKSVSLDLYDQYNYLENSKGGFRFTSPVHAIRAFDQSITELNEEGGILARYKRYCGMQSVLTKGMSDLKFKKLDLGEYQGPIITTFHTPKCKKYNFNTFYEKLKEQRCIIYPGKLAAVDSFRIGTIGSLNAEDIHYLLNAVEKSIFWNNEI